MRPIRIGSEVQTSRRGIYVQLMDTLGHSGWGEIAPLDGYGPDTLREIKDAISSFSSLESNDNAKLLPPSFRFGLDCAQRELNAKRRGNSFRDTFGPLLRPLISSATLLQPTGSVSNVPTDLRFVKAKVGGNPIEQDVDRVSRLLEHIPPNGALRLDANGLWSKDEAYNFAEQLTDKVGAGIKQIEFIEEPWKGCFDTAASFPIPLAIDESFSFNATTWKHAAVVMIKPSLLGSIDEFNHIASAILAEGKRLVLSSAFETHLGMSALIALATTLSPLPNQKQAEGFGTLGSLDFSNAMAPKQLSSLDWMKSSEIDASRLSAYPGDLIHSEAISLIDSRSVE